MINTAVSGTVCSICKSIDKHDGDTTESSSDKGN